jgi:flagellar L-ring protein FlgH
MKKLNKLTLFILFLLTSCSSLINDMHKDLAEDERRYNERPVSSQFDQFRKGKHKQGKRISTSSRRSLLPKVKRKYEDSKSKRIKSDDLKDNDNVGSLWAGSGNDGFLFTKDTDKQNGDIVVISVFKKFKNEISTELKRYFPDPPPESKKEEEEKKEEKPASREAKDDEVIDKISTVVIEEINRNHLLIRGRKALIYKKRKRLVEIQALVNRRDIADDDTIGSDKFLESSIHVLR